MSAPVTWSAPDAPDPAQVFSLRGRTVVVTGASTGLGHRFATVLAAAGADVIAGARRLDRLEALAAGVPRIHPVRCDVTAVEDRENLIEAAISRTGRLDVLVNNAGLGGHGAAQAESPEMFRQALEVNLVAPFHLACLAVAAADNPPGETAPGVPAGRSIINVASILGLVSGAPFSGAGYAASKAGLIGLTRELAGQWGRTGVRVNALAPGWFRSEMTQDLFDDERSRAWVARNAPMRRAGQPEELDGALLFLASAASSYTTGQVLVVDGGWTAR